MAEREQIERSQRVRRHCRRHVASIGGLACLIALALFLRLTREPQIDRLKRQVREAVPVGATRDQAIAWARRMGAHSVHECDLSTLLSQPEKTLPEVGGVPRCDLKLFVEVVIPCGAYHVNGELAQNHMWVFLPLDSAGAVTGHYFLTLEELAEHERSRARRAAH
jgi:hypothetical protein